jgi:hypothetical protein
VGKQRLEHRGVAGLPGCDRNYQRTALTVDELVDLGRYPATGSAERMIGRLDAEILVVRVSPP